MKIVGGDRAKRGMRDTRCEPRERRRLGCERVDKGGLYAIWKRYSVRIRPSGERETVAGEGFETPGNRQAKIY